MIDMNGDRSVVEDQFVDNNNNNNINNAQSGSVEASAGSQENLRNIEIPKHDQSINSIDSHTDINRRSRIHSFPVSRESLEENDSIIVTRVATEDTMSSSPSSYASSRNIPITTNAQNMISIDRRPSPLAFKDSTTKPTEASSLSEEREYDNDTNTNKNNVEEQDTKNDEHTEDQNPLMIQITNIINLPTDTLIKMVTALLEKIVQSNDKLGGLHQNNEPLERLPIDDDKIDDYFRSCYNAALSFRGKHVPQIDLEQYFHRIQKYCPITNDVYLSLLIYFDRISKKCNSIADIPGGNEENVNKDKEGNYDNTVENMTNSQIFVMDSFNIHRLIITAVTVSTKFSSDFFYSNSRYSKVGGISLKEMNYLELQFLILCDFNLLISIDEFERYATLLYRFWDSLETV